jgi:hypothetical protein
VNLELSRAWREMAFRLFGGDMNFPDALVKTEMSQGVLTFLVIEAIAGVFIEPSVRVTLTVSRSKKRECPEIIFAGLLIGSLSGISAPG